MDPAIEFVQELPTPLVFLLGPKPAHDYLIKSYEETVITKKTSLNFQSYPLETKFAQSVLANTPSVSKKGKGLFSLSWLRRYRLLIPSVVVAVYDWSNEDPAVSKLSWSNYEHTLAEKHKELVNETATFGSYLIEIVLINPKILGPHTMDEVPSILKRNLNVDFKQFFVVFRGIDGFASSMKKYLFSKLLMEKSQEFYKEQRTKIKKKLAIREKMPTGQLSTLKSYTKLGFFYEFSRNTIKALKYFKQSYSLLCQLLPQIKKAFDTWEIKAFADCVMLKFAKVQFSVGQAQQVLALFGVHYSTFKQLPGEANPRFEYMEYKWRAVQLNRMARFMQGGIQQGDPIPRRVVEDWLVRLHFGCAKMLIQERACLEQNNLKWNPDTKKYEFDFDVTEANEYTFVDSNYLGKERKCVVKGTDTAVDPLKALEIINNIRIRREYNPDVSNDIVALLRQVIALGAGPRKKLSIEVLILREYRRMGKQADYTALKKKIVDTLTKDKWERLATLILREDNEFVNEYVETDTTGMAFEMELEELANSQEEPTKRSEKFRNLFEKIMKTQLTPESTKYSLKQDNTLLQFYVGFTKNPVRTYDDTTLKLRICPIVTFPFIVDSITLNFSEKSLSKAITHGKELKADESQEYEEHLYINPGISGIVTLQNITITMQLPTPNATTVHFEVIPNFVESNLLSDATSGTKSVQLHILNTERLITTSLIHKQPAFLGERYPFTVKVAQMDTYEVTNLLVTFCEVMDEDKPRERTNRKPSNNRKASIVSADSSESPDWSYVLYVEKDESEDGSSVHKLPHHHYSINNLEGREQSLKFYMQFREEGRKNFELIFRYTVKKVFNDGSKGAEFILENKEYFYIDVLCPFVLASEWLTPEPCMNCANAQFYFAGQAKTHLGIGKKAMLGVKISTGSFPSVEVHDVRLKVKDDGVLKLVEDYTNEISTWKKWPVVLGVSESLSASFSVLPLVQFNDQQVADVEILWNRADEKSTEKTVCSIPLPQVTATDSCVDVLLTSVPPKAVKFKEFFVRYELRNTTAAVIETKVNMEENPHFFLAGEVVTKVILPPYESDEVRFGMVPLRCGKFELPSITISMVATGGVCEPIIDNNFKHSIYVFPS